MKPMKIPFSPPDMSEDITYIWFACQEKVARR